MLLADRLAFEVGLGGPGISRPAGVIAAAVGALLVSAAVAAAALVLRPTPPARIAWRLDCAAGGEERFLSALEVASAGAGGPLGEALLRDAARLARDAEPASVLPRPPVGYRWGIAISIAAAAALLAWPPVLYEAPAADFEAHPSRGPAPLEVEFRDASVGAIRDFLWEFGDGGTGAGETAAHVYQMPGRYEARLRLRGPGGESVRSRQIEVLPPDHAVADFEAEPLKGRVPLDVRFRNLSRNALRHKWDFGDGGSSDSPEPTHRYLRPGHYTVRLEVSNEISRDVRIRGRYIKAAAEDAPLADFRALPVEGEAPLRVHFEDLSSGAVAERRWDFGDLRAGEDNLSSERNPFHDYWTPGCYTVKLRVRGPQGEDEEEKIHYIRVTDPGSGGRGRGGAAAVRPRPAGRDKSPGGAGDRPGRDFGEKSARPKVTLVPEGVTPHTSGGELTEKIKVVGRRGGGKGTLEEVDYGRIYPEYRRIAEDSINRELIPPAYRETLRIYYGKILPRPE